MIIAGKEVRISALILMPTDVAADCACEKTIGRASLFSRSDRSAHQEGADGAGSSRGLVQLGGLEPPTSCSTDRNLLSPTLRSFTLGYELFCNFNIKHRTEYATTTPVFCYRGSYVVAKRTSRCSDGFGKYHDQSRASTRFG